MLILSEVNQTKTDTVRHHLYVESKMKIQMTFFTKQKRTHKGRKQMQLPKEKWTGRDKVGVWNEQIHTTTQNSQTGCEASSEAVCGTQQVIPENAAQHVLYAANDHVCALGTIFQGWGPEFEWCLLEDTPQLPITRVIASAPPTFRLQFGLSRCV